MVIGTTAERPVNDPGLINWPPSVMYDSTLSSDIFLVQGSKPARWVNLLGAAV